MDRHSLFKAIKTIKVIGIPKLVGQAKYIGQLLEDISQKNNNLSSVAVVLGEENLLIPVLNSIPKAITKLNVTMGLPLKYVPLASFFDFLFSIHKNNPKSFYFKDVIAILSHSSIYPLFNSESGNNSSKLVAHIQKNNLVYITAQELIKLAEVDAELINLLFKPWEDKSEIALKNCASLILKMKENFGDNKQNYRLELEYFISLSCVI